MKVGHVYITQDKTLLSSESLLSEVSLKERDRYKMISLNYEAKGNITEKVVHKTELCVFV